MRPLADAAVCRSESDWLVGINGTRAMTAFNSKSGGFQLTTVGRVQTPTLAILVEREEKIRAFVPRDYWEVLGTFRASGGEYAGRWFDEKFKKQRRRPRRAAPSGCGTRRGRAAIAAKCAGKPGIVTEESKPSTQSAPLLYDLTSLQREANGRFGFSARTTLSLAQALYEKHKVLTYPRTDSRALPEDYLGTVKATMEALGETNAYGGFARAGAEAEVGAAQQAHLRQRQDLRPLRDHPDAGAAEEPERARGASSTISSSGASSPCSIPPAEFLVTTRITRVAGEPFKTEGKVLVAPGLARRLRQGGAGRRGDARRRSQPGEKVATEKVDVVASTHAPAAAPQRSHAAVGDGRRGQADRRRGAARGDAREGPRHAGHARADHRGPDRREATSTAKARSSSPPPRRSR